ncbi:hypothetical protein [Brevibacillus borstelensis]|uniref:hypothetical protein n=1 Tax=Brevibacillus borstelensis TaxID=45462 RepID=UPI0030BA61B1
MHRIGVVGPQPSVERMIDMGKEFEKDMRFFPYPYERFQETRELVKTNADQVDVWLFSGKLSYMIARQELGTAENMVHVQHTEASLYRCFLMMAKEQGRFLERVSIDELEKTQLDFALQQLEIEPRDVYLKIYDVDTNPEELLDFHLQLWREGKTDGAITCFEGIYRGLKAAGVPVYWFTPTRLEILQTFRIVAEKVRTLYFKDTQIGVEIIEIEQFDRVAEKAKSPYHLQHLELRLKEALLHLCEKLNGSLLEKGNGRYVVFSSRGAIEREIDILRETIRQLSLVAESMVAVGVGFGETVFTAEVNARRAIQQSKEKAERGIVIVQEDGTVIEAAGLENELAYSSRMQDREFLDKLKKGNISVRTYNKIEALVRRMGWSDFTTKDLALHLHLDERNARRIVAYLCEVDLAECVGEESVSTRGRPSKIYRLK